MQYLFCYPDVLNGDVKKIEGKLRYTQYDTQLKKLVKQLDIQPKIIGFEAGDIGYHSCHKGVAAMVAAGCTVYHPIVALCIRSG